jgi:hypothetical protein
VKTLDCGHVPSAHGEHTTGTAHTHDGKEICWDCCALLDTAHMLVDGSTQRLPMYLSRKSILQQNDGTWFVSNWPGSLSFPVQRITKGKHNIARTRYDVWFYGPDGFIWHGVQFGEWTQICHCKRTRERIS